MSDTVAEQTVQKYPAEGCQVHQSVYGSRLLPQVVDERATSDPTRTYASISLTTDVSKGFRDVTFKEIAQGTNHLAWWLEKRIGRAVNFETLAYLGIPDLRHPIIFLAAVKCGYKLLLLSPQDALATDVSLLGLTECIKFLHSPEVTPLVQRLRKEKPEVQYVEVEALDNILQAPSEHYPYHETIEKARENPVVIIHTSGSTGLPKPIIMNHGTFAAGDSSRALPRVIGRRSMDASMWDFTGGGRYYSPIPPYHLGGFMSMLTIPIFSDAAIPVLGPSLIPPSGSLASQIMKHQKLRALFLWPAAVEQLVQEPEALDRIKQLDFILYAGGPLSASTGDVLSKLTNVCSSYGSTETGAIPGLFPSREDWSYLEWHPSVEVDMQPSINEKYECVLHNDPAKSSWRPVFQAFPDVSEWRTGDLFEPHPSKPNLWRFFGRLDNFITLSNGVSLNPIPMENSIQSDPLLKGAVILGNGRRLPALLVEPRLDIDENNLLIERIWPTIEKANLEGPEKGRIIRSMVMVSNPDKPLPRAAKGTIVRKLTADAYKSEIDQLYLEKRPQ